MNIAETDNEIEENDKVSNIVENTIENTVILEMKISGR